MPLNSHKSSVHRPLNVLQLASTSDMGGAERMIAVMVAALPNQQVCSSVACLIGSGELLRRVAPHCKATLHLNCRFPFSIIKLFRLARFMKRERIDVLHTYGLRADTLGRLAAKIAGVPIVVSGIRSTDPWRKKHHTFIDRLTSPLVDCFVSNSLAGKAATVEREGYAPQRIEVIYSGIDPATINTAPHGATPPPLDIPQGAWPVVAVLANIREMKGHADMVRALPLLVGQFPKIHYVFAGRDDSHGAIRQLAAELGVARHISFPNYVNDTSSVLTVADMFCLPSQWEGLPVSVLEAMYAKLPIITTNVGGIPELVRDRQECLMVSPNQPEELAAAISRLCTDQPFAATLASNAHARAHELFTITTMVQKHVALYERLYQEKTNAN